ncbi:MAG: nucleotide exchange factor GrpE [Pseudoxanthomonas sp.]
MTSNEHLEPAAVAADPDQPQRDTEALLQAEVESLRGELEQLRASVLLDRADLENQRKRLAREAEQARRFANERLLQGLLPVFDSLDAGLAAAGAEPSPLREGLELTQKQLLKVADDNGLAVLDPTGQPFDPEQHQAVSQVAPNPALPAGTVAQVFQKGYLLGGRLLRPALVVVANG